MSEQNKAHNVLTRQVTDWTRERDRLDDLIAHATGAIHPEDSRAAPKGNHDFYAGVCAALSCVLAHDAGTLWREIVQSVGTDDLLQYAAHDEQDEWEVAGFSRYSNAELGRGKPKLRRAIADHSGAAAEMVASQSADPVALPARYYPDFDAGLMRQSEHGAWVRYTAATGAQGLTSQRVEEIAKAYFHQYGTELGDMKTAIRVAVREALAQSAPAATAPSETSLLGCNDAVGAARCRLAHKTGHEQPAKSDDMVLVRRDVIAAACHAISHQKASEKVLNCLRSAAMDTAAPSDGARQAVQWDLFPGWLIDHHEGETITEEMLQFALADMLKAHPAAPSPIESPDYKARFETMVSMIGEISDALGIPDDEAACANGHDLILAAIARLRKPSASPETMVHYGGAETPISFEDSASPADADEDAYVIDRLGKLLAEVAIALKGPDLAQHRHSYHDLPQVAQTMVLELDMYRTLYGKQAPTEASASPAAPTGDDAPAAPVMPDILLPLKIRNDRDMLNYLHQAFEREVHVCERCHDKDPARNTDSAYFLREYLAAAPVPPSAPQNAAQDARDAEKIGEMVCGDIEAHIDGYEVGDYELIYGKQLDEINVNHPGKVFAIYIDRAAMGTEGPNK
ncbi:hypothetical protein [Cupriavidus nantongensis]|uniref:Uncharacterized protein n=1 Tax=Cupriavidus nantongensis TaxID=1796606 RepID=A0A142JMI6_9BURK|nr:hypothetical protein [Cupriavidus nantongensis]AMR79298.1 hypothetical protein A2G96_17015 [Cupriavidus nantongensis]